MTALRLRSRIASARLIAERHALAARPAASERRSRILCYHAVGTPSWGVNDISTERFRMHLEEALRAGWTFVDATDLASGRGPSTGALAVTFDDGLRSVASGAAPVLRELDIPWTMFVVSDWADEGSADSQSVFLSWKEVSALAAAGVTIGSHSATHPDFGRISLGQTQDELGRSKDSIERVLGAPVTQFAIPLGQHKNWTADAAQAAEQAGYSMVFAQADQTRPDATIPRTFVTRHDTKRVFHAALGGAYARWEEWF